MLLAFYLVTANPATTGMPLHEYLAGRRLWLLSCDGDEGRRSWPLDARVLNGVLLAALAFCVVSGIMVSGALLPSLGLYATGYYFWDPVHALSAKVLLAALLVHIVLRIPVVMSVFRRHSSNSFAR
ncbi:MAG: DUF4405 domain-containing protein [Coriobacteriaceae bacterium]